MKIHVKRFKRHTAFLLLICTLFPAFSLSMTGCSSSLKEPVRVTGYKLNTYVNIDAYTDGGYSTDKLNEILKEALALCDTYEKMFSRTDSDSTLYKLNHGETDVVPESLGELISYGIDYGRLSGGAFDITIGSVSSLWDFTSDSPAVPDADKIEEALRYVDYTKVELSRNTDGTYTVSMPENTIIDLGAVAKGYIADRIRDFLLEKGINHAIINLGGNVLCIGAKDSSTPFSVGIKRPFSEDASPLVTLNIDNKSVVSSGNYERYFYQDDTLYHHILNPKTGYPYNNGLTDVTIISDLSVTGDCLSTTCFALGLEEGMKLIEDTEGVEAMFVETDGTIHYSSGFETYLK